MLKERIIGGHELRISMPDRATLLATALQTNSLGKLPNILARQVGIFRGWDSSVWHGRISIRSRLEAARMLLDSRKPIEPQVLMCCEAIMRCGVPLDIDPRLFDRRIVSAPSVGELLAWGLTESDVNLTRARRGIRSGSALFIYLDSVDDHIVWMSEVQSGPYRGRFTIGGGHSDNMIEVAALEEAREEAGINSFFRAEPLGVADQIIAVQRDGKTVLERYINYMWVYYLRHGERPVDNEIKRRWIAVTDEVASQMMKERALTPVAECALRLMGPLFM